MEFLPYASLQPTGPSCLIIVDLQKQFINANTRHIFPGIQNLLGRFTYTIASRFRHQENGPIHKYKKWRAAAEGTEGAELAIELSPCPPESTLVVEKSLFSAFVPTTRDWLQHKGVKEIYVCGMDIDLCVTRTLFDILENGYRPILLADLSATTAGEPCYTNALLQLKRMMGREQILLSQSQSQATPA